MKSRSDNTIYFTFLLANVDMGKQDKNGIVIRMFNILSAWEKSNRHKLFQHLDAPKWIIPELDDVICSENYRPDYYFEGDILFVSMVVSYRASIDNKTFNKLKVMNSDLAKYVNNPSASFANFHHTLVQGIEYMDLEQNNNEDSL